MIKSKETKQIDKHADDAVKTLRRKKRHSYFKDDLTLFLMCVPALLVVAVFAYVPMPGIILAFKKYTAKGGIFGSKWIGWKNFEFFFKSGSLWRIVRNTVLLNVMFISGSTIAGVAFALLMFEVKKARHVKLYQTVSILPHFISWVACSYIFYTFLEPTSGAFNKILQALGFEGIQWYSRPELWPGLLLLITLWHGVGMGSIIYYAALLGADPDLYDAVELDGASKWQRTWYVSLPTLIPIICIKTILAVGGIFRSDFGLFYNVPRNLSALLPTTDVIDTFVYRALMELNNYGMSSAAGLVQSAVCMICILGVNLIVRKISPEHALF